MKRILQLLAGTALAFWPASVLAEIQRGEMYGYLLFDGQRVPTEFNAGFSLYAAAWPLVDHYPGHDFQTGLLSTWMHPLYQAGEKPKEECYTDIEGGLGWWRDTHFPTTTQTFKATGGSSWSFYPPGVPRKQAASVAWKSFATSVTPDPLTLGFRWSEELTRKNGLLVTLPEFFRLGQEGERQRWSVVSAEDVPAGLGLTRHRFETPKEEPQKPRATPDAPGSCWKTPGPAAGPFQAVLGDGSVVTYCWYRFADQPAMLNADLTPAEREVVQKRVEKLHRAWSKDRDYLAPPEVGSLAAIDPALILTPPTGLEAGYVPIATRQELKP